MRTWGAFFLVCCMFLVSACNSTEQTLASAASDTASAADQTKQQSSVGARINIAPITGAPLQAVSPLSRRLSEGARTRNLTLVPTGDATATIILKGYFSALADTGEIAVIYVWDVNDPQGNRLHRIQGQEKSPGQAVADPWAAVPPELMERIADETLADLAAWLASNAPTG